MGHSLKLFNYKVIIVSTIQLAVYTEIKSTFVTLKSFKENKKDVLS